MKFRTNEKIDTKKAFEDWLRIYNMYHYGNELDRKMAESLAIEMMSSIIKDMAKDAWVMKTTNPYYSLQDVEDLEQSMYLIVIEKLPGYTPYKTDSEGHQVQCLGSSFLYYWLKEALSDYSRGGDGLGHGAVPKYHEKKKGKPGHDSYEYELANPTSKMRQLSSGSPEDAYFERVAEEELRRFNAFVSKYDVADRKKAALLYASTRLAAYGAEDIA